MRRGTAFTRRDLLAGLFLLPVAAGGAACAGGPHLRIAALDWAATETLLVLGAAPIAVGDRRRYIAWLPEPPLPGNVADLGLLNEPNLELLARLAPDIIVISSWAAFSQPRLAEVATVLTVEIYKPGGSPLQAGHELLNKLARLTGTEERASLYEGMALAALSTRAIVANYEPPPLYIAVLNEDGRHSTTYGAGSLVQDVIGRLGLSNAWRGRSGPFGNAVIGIEEFADNPSAQLLYLDQGARTARALRSLSGSALWQGLPCVQAGRVKAIPAFYPSGGLPTAVRLAGLLSSFSERCAGD